MFVAIRHEIDDYEGFEARAESIPENTPPTMLVHQFFPAQDTPEAFCLWEAEDLGALTAFLDGALEGVSTQEYHPVDAANAFGLPTDAAPA